MSAVGLPPLWHQQPSLRGPHASLEPLQAAHADGLREAVGDGALSRLWYTSVPAPEQVDAYIAAALAACADGAALPFAVRDAAGDIVGCTRYYALDAAVPRLSIGYTWYAPRVQRSGVNTEAKLMLLQYAFETLGCLSVVFETSWFNHTSRAAIARLGAKQDGVLRNHTRHADGTLRDTVVFSIIDTEWAGVKRHLQFRLEENA
ncbi:GNAT family N-acetyltransferase [Xanthomonas citri pv. anacardii]|uniref:GNAT family N-acetyltransferase n=1 Tax=Xanthomonas citri TaxID=346 RepID=UPI000CCC20EC|nr:GNAT family N-acetyltransferase [Xanthomonas citri]MCT8355949.1 GNAT family N-acetyltransferase [Xanthomonas citri pv. anacardii]MCT8359997.1 GNAT family N-acetyltransferase [Xanthomonas citri pv. anacardii]MCT8363424.1 GNAT family N-acetyltransferase [Xanthomonas citri pv. anacardii]MCT8367781.1 GNAT family N-acetyltransferase [Xanthomonas citri pv. anacardii]MCT8372065.1 GNAT family N-acetyltransferase [Xanthomonas citri pv. anacardii]